MISRCRPAGQRGIPCAGSDVSQAEWLSLLSLPRRWR